MTGVVSAMEHLAARLSIAVQADSRHRPHWTQADLNAIAILLDRPASPSPDCPRCAALTRERDDAIAVAELMSGKVNHIAQPFADAEARVSELTRERDEARAWFMERFFDENDDREPEDVPLAEYAQRCFEWGDQAWYTAGKEAERSQMAARDLAQARQALQRIAELPNSGYESVAAQYFGTAKRVACEALVERGTSEQTDTGGAE